jgi:hypothetical protein
MASLPLASAHWQPETPRQLAASDMIGKVVPARLSALEWSVVALAEHDRVSSLREPGRIATALNTIFGSKSSNRLANERLEALRRVSVLAWRYRWNVAESELQRFFEAGFNADHYELIQQSIGESIARRARKSVR